MEQKAYQFTGVLEHDENALMQLFANCADIKKKEMCIGQHQEIRIIRHR